MDEKWVARVFANYRKGVFTASEFADWFLCEQAFEKDFDAAFFATVELPDEVWRAFDWILRSVREAGFRYQPVTVGGRSRPADPARLRLIVEAFQPRASALRAKPGADAPPRSWEELLRRYSAGERSFAYAELDSPPYDDLRGAILDGADLSRSYLVADFRGAKLRRAQLWHSNLKTCDFRDSDLEGADLSFSALDATQFAGANLTGTQFQGATCSGLKLARGAKPDW